MKSTTKIWLGVGAFVVVGAGGAVQGPSVARALFDTTALAGPQSEPAAPEGGAVRLAQHRKHGGGEKGGERGEKGAQGGKKGGEGGEGEEGGEGGRAALSPDLDFAVRIAQMRGHLLVGDELVKESQWNAAYAHFRHPTEELYGKLRGRLKEYNVPPFEAALKSLANVVRSKKGGDDYAKARKAVMDAFAAADAGLKTKQAKWESFTVETALETLKSAAGEYEEAVVKGRIAKPVEYQDARVHPAGGIDDRERGAVAGEEGRRGSRPCARGARRAEESVSGRDAAKTPVKDYGAVLGDVSRVELALGKLM
jgi:hypothetical protein